MGCKASKNKTGDEPPSLADQYADVIPFEEVGGDFTGDSTMFYEDIADIEKSVAYLKAHPKLEITVDVHLECPKECNKQRCGKCTKDQCNNVAIGEVQCEAIEKILMNSDCKNKVNRNIVGCRDESIRKDILRISVSEPKPPEPEPDPVKPEPKPDTSALEERERALKQREAAMMSQEALLADKLSAVDREKREVEAEKKKLSDEKKALKSAQDEQEEIRVANETAAQEAERKRLAYEKAARIAAEKAKEADEAKQNADRKKSEYEAAAKKVEEERKREHDKIKSIMYEIEETLKEEIEFHQNSPELTDQGKVICKKVLPFLLKLPDMIINIESHTNCKKGKCDNGCHLMDLSQQRVETVKHYLIEHGATNEFHTKGWGCRHPELKNVRMVRIYPDHSHKETYEVSLLGDLPNIS